MDSNPIKPSTQQLFSIPEVVTVRSGAQTKHPRLVQFSLWVYIIAGAFLGLVVVTGVTLWISFNSAPQKIASAPVDLKRPFGTTDLLTGGPSTPATKSVVFKETTLPLAWLRQQFNNRPGVIDGSGTCLKLTICTEISDPDQDGLLNIYEYQYATDPNEPDTDKDGLTDTLELFVFFTNPKQIDSSGDLVSDFDTLITCKDPLDNEILSDARKAQISSDITVFPIKQPTIGKLQNTGATKDDIEKFGYIVGKCTKPVTE